MRFIFPPHHENGMRMYYSFTGGCQALMGCGTNVEQERIPLLAMSHIFCWTSRTYSQACHVPHLLLDTGALKTTEGKAEVPSLDKEGWPRPLRKCREASSAGADGVVGSSHRLSEVERTTPFLMFRPTGLTLRAAPPKERDHLLDGAASPPLPRRGLRLSRRLSQTPVFSGRLVGNDQL